MPTKDIALNVTGSTKLMAVAAQVVFRSAEKPVFYVNVESDEPGLRVDMTPVPYDSRTLAGILDLFIETGLPRQNDQAFKNEENRFLVNSSWLESHVYEALQPRRAQHEALSDVTMDVPVSFGGTDSSWHATKWNRS